MRAKTFWSKMPMGYFESEMNRLDRRDVEIEAEFNIVFNSLIGIDFLKKSIYLTPIEQDILDFEIETMQFGFEGDLVRNLIHSRFSISQDIIQKSLDRVEAKYHYRNFLKLEPIPPRRYKNISEGYWSDFFEFSS